MQRSDGGGGEGTPHYMAPEQFDRYGIISEAADIWGLAVTLYQCLTGKLPFGEKRTPPRKIQKAVEKLEDDARVMQNPPEEWIDILVTDEQQIKELELLIQYYEANEDYTKAASAFKQLTDLRKIQRDNE